MYFEYEDFKYIEDQIIQLTDDLNKYYTLPEYERVNFELNEPVYIEKIKHIEDGINQLNLYNLNGFSYKTWDINPSEIKGVLYIKNQNFSRINDYNRWLLNLALVRAYINALKNIEIRYSGNGYSGERTWLA